MSQVSESIWVNDFIRQYDLDKAPALQSFLLKEVSKLTRSLPFELKPASQLLSEPYSVKHLIKGVLSENSLSTVYGPSGSMKTFTVLSMAYSIATATDWFGKKSEPGHVIYLAGEGYAGLKSRLKVLVNHHGKAADNLLVSSLPARLSDEKNVQEIIDSIQQACDNPKLIIVDTLHRNMGDGDENSASDMARIINSLDKLRYETGAAVLLVHHTGHGTTDRARGSSSIRAAMDHEYQVISKNGLVTMKCTKSKDAKEPETITFEPLTVDTGWLDEDGFPITSVVLESVSSGNELVSLSGQARQVLMILNDSIQQNGIGLDKQQRATLDGEGWSGMVVLESDWRESVIAVLTLEMSESSASKAFRRARKVLLEKEYINASGEYVCVLQQ